MINQVINRWTKYALPTKEKRREGSLDDTDIDIIMKKITQQDTLYKTDLESKVYYE